MKIRRFLGQSLGVSGIALVFLSGCQGTFPTMGPLSSPTSGRVPAPATGSFSVPGNYSPGSQPVTPAPGNRATSQNQRPIGTGIAADRNTSASSNTGTIIGAVQEEGWHAIQEGKVVAASATTAISNELQNQANQAATAAQAGFSRITSRLNEETNRLVNEYAPPVNPASAQLKDIPEPQTSAGSGVK
ncbi:MAG: hypothetical protein U0905_15675 [Pirellulales bacterium]